MRSLKNTTCLIDSLGNNTTKGRGLQPQLLISVCLQTHKHKHGKKSSVLTRLVCRESPYWQDEVLFSAVKLQRREGQREGRVAKLPPLPSSLSVWILLSSKALLLAWQPKINNTAGGATSQSPSLLLFNVSLENFLGITAATFHYVSPFYVPCFFAISHRLVYQPSHFILRSTGTWVAYVALGLEGAGMSEPQRQSCCCLSKPLCQARHAWKHTAKGILPFAATVAEQATLLEESVPRRSVHSKLRRHVAPCWHHTNKQLHSVTHQRWALVLRSLWKAQFCLRI